MIEGDIEDIYSLSPLQEGFLFHALSEERPTQAYLVQMTFELTGALDLEMFKESWRRLFDRHAILRTAFVHDDIAKPVQVVIKGRYPEFSMEDLTSAAPAEQARFIDEYREGDRHHSFDVQRGALMRIRVFRRGEGAHTLVWTYHHLLLDGWCLAILRQEFLEIYQALVQGVDPPLARARPYGDYIRWLGGLDTADAKSYWARYLDGFENPAVVPSLADRTAERLGDSDSQTWDLVLDSKLSEGLSSLAHRLHVTLNVLIQTAWALLLARYNNSSDVVFGSVVSGRPAELDGVERMVGLFINTIPVRLRVQPGESFSAMAQRTQRGMVEGLSFHHHPLVEIQAGNPLGSALFDHIVVFDNYPVSDAVSSAETSDLDFRIIDTYDRNHYSFSLVVVPGENLRISFLYDGNAYHDVDIERCARHFEMALRNVRANPEAAASAIEVCTPEEQRELLTWSQGSVKLPLSSHTIVEEFEAQADRVPDAIAVKFGETKISYRQLSRSINTLAAFLSENLGVGSEQRIGIALRRSDQLIVAILAVLKAGAAYVPIDPSYPSLRVKDMLSDSGCTLVLTDARSRKALPAQGAAVVELPIQTHPREQMKSRARPDDVAYVLYTSGSTGQPKGCEIEHASLLGYLEWSRRFYFEGSEGGSFGLFTSLSFDLTVTSLFLPLLRGKTLVVFSQEAETTDILEDVFSGRAGIDSVKLTPSHVSLIEYLDLSSTPIRLAVVGGEAFSTKQLGILHRLNPQMRVFNEYGPTEATVGCVVEEAKVGQTTVPIGRPIDNARAYVLDAMCGLSPVGVTGMLHVGGPGLARGYVNRDDLSQKSFIPDPHRPGERIYKTGDLARWLPGGVLEYLGRADAQVKIRGYRIEPAEIEATIETLPGVSRSVVVGLPTGAHAGSEVLLVAYIESTNDIDSQKMREHLYQVLPDFMIPSRFVFLPRLPQTTNGKIDRARLPVFARAVESDSGEFSDPIEEQVARIWAEVLGENPRPSVSFFELGGHSLKAMQVRSRIQLQFGVALRAESLLSASSVAETAALIRAAQPTSVEGIEPVSPQPHYDMSHAQGRLWLLHQMGGQVAYNMPRAHIYEGELDVVSLRTAIVALAGRHEALRTSFVVVDGTPKQFIAPEVAPLLVELDLTHEAVPEDAARAAAVREATSPFDLETAPLLRFTLMALAPTRHVLLLTMHHIIGDGWSLIVLYNELLALYESSRSRRPDPLPPVPIHYKDFAAWQNHIDFSADEGYWLEALAGAPEGIRLPRDFWPSEDRRDFRGETARLTFDPSLFDSLSRLAVDKGATLSNVILVSFALALWSTSRQDDFCIGVSSANRNRSELERIIGFFVNVLPIRIRIAPDTPLSEIVARVVQSSNKALDHQEYPFDLMIEKLNPERCANRQPLLNVIYGFQSFQDIRLEGEELAQASSAFVDSREFEVPTRTSKFDLCLFVSEVDSGLMLELEYDGGLFLPSTAETLLKAIEEGARALTEVDDRPAGALTRNAVDEKLRMQDLDQLIRTATDYPRYSTVHSLVSEQAEKLPLGTAVICRHSELTYGALDRRSNEVAAFLQERGVRQEEFVAVLLDRSPEMIVTLLGILKSGAAYVPLTGDMPHERLRLMLDDTEARVLISEKRYLGLSHKLHWECPLLRDFMCIDSDDVKTEVEESGGIMDPAIWEYVAEQAFDEISGGGWTSSYTGEWLSQEVMDEYGENIRTKLAPYLDNSSRVLEVGCASGISMWRLAPLVGFYYGTDLSTGIVRWAEQEVARRKLSNIRLAALPAHEIDRAGETGFDVVVINSVIECFRGHGYFRDVLRKAIASLKGEGYLFLGNVWDQDLKQEFLKSLAEFKRQNPERARRAKLDRTEELFISQSFLEDLRFDFTEIAEIEFSSMIGSSESELSRFGYDALIRIDKTRSHPAPSDRHRYQFDRASLKKVDAQSLSDRSGPGSLAYMMYTSGTSGRPKGVMIEHRSIVRLVRNTNYIDLDAADRVLQAGALSFDASTFEIWGPLLNGGSVVLPEGKSFLSPVELTRLIRQYGVTGLFLTTGLFNQMAGVGAGVFAGLHFLLTGGEKASAHHFNTVRALFPELQLKHVYGPTEGTTFSTYYDVTHAHGTDVPIGIPVSNTTAILLDDKLQPVLPGEAGELCIGGDGLARGYWKDDELTGRKFISHPSIAGERLYRTGDLVRHRRDGELDFLGRIDTQVKIRGFRIELEELESVLLGHPRVSAAAAVARDPGDGVFQLIAFVAGHELDVEELRENIRVHLSDYLMPSQFVILKELTLNVNGKVDRAMLPMPPLEGRREGTHQPPATVTESRLVEIWKRLLRRPDVGATDNFFDLGGHSLTAVKLISTIQEEIGVEVPLADILGAQTVRDLAAYIDDSSRLGRDLIDQPMVLFNRGKDLPALFAFPPGSGYPFAYQSLARLLPGPFYGFSFVEHDSRLEDYVKLIREKSNGSPLVLFGFSAGGKLAFRVAQELEQEGLRVSDLILFDAARYFYPVQFSQADMRDAAAEFLEGVSSRVLREKALVRIEKYRQFLGDCIESGCVDANIHMVRAEGSPLTVLGEDGRMLASLDRWADLTKGAFHLHQGSGEHRRMLTSPFLERNASLIVTIVSKRGLTPETDKYR